MSRRSRGHNARRTPWHRHGRTLALCLLVLVALVLMGLLIWLMSDMRFRAR